MSLRPAFRIGLWNAWIFMLYALLSNILLWPKSRREDEQNEFAAMNKTEKRVFHLSKAITLSLLIYSIFLPLQVGTIWFYIGLPISLLGLIVETIVLVNIATTPLGEPFTKGLYRYSRHPMYISDALTLIGVSIACASWLFLLLSMAYTTLYLMNAIPEERWCLEKYGDAYREYMDRTPRWIGIPKSGEK